MISAIVLEVGLGDNKDNAFAGFDNFACEGLIKLAMWLGAIYEKAANICFFDGGESAERGEFLDADFPTAWAA